MLDFGGGDGDFQVSDEDINIGISMKKGNTALKDAINKVLATMTTDDYNTMMDEAISVQPLSEEFCPPAPAVLRGRGLGVGEAEES